MTTLDLVCLAIGGTRRPVTSGVTAEEWGSRVRDFLGHPGGDW